MGTYYVLIKEFSDYDMFSYNIQGIYTDKKIAHKEYFKAIKELPKLESGNEFTLYKWSEVAPKFYWKAHCFLDDDKKSYEIDINQFPNEQNERDEIKSGDTPKEAYENIVEFISNTIKKPISNIKYTTWEEQEKIWEEKRKKNEDYWKQDCKDK